MAIQAIARLVLVCVLVVGAASAAFAQQDREVDRKQSDLKREYNEAKEKQMIIRDAAEDKPRPTTGRRRGNTTTGYDYTQVKGFSLRAMYDRIDQVFASAETLELFEDEFHVDGTFDVPGRSGKGSAQIKQIEVYYAEATPEEMDIYGVEPYDLIEIRVIKTVQLPPEEFGGEGEESLEFGAFSSSGTITSRQFILSGTDLWTVIELTDPALYDDVLARRSQEPTIPLPADLVTWDKRGPFVIMGERDLETAISRFEDFWNVRDTLRTAQIPPQSEASGPLSTTYVPLLYPETNEVRLRNPNNTPLKITEAYFTGDNASEFNILSKTPVLLAPRGEQNDRTDIQFEYVGDSPYETRAELFIDAGDARMSQGLEVVANPGLFPADIVVIDASLDQIELRSPARSGFAPDWKLAYRIGNPEINMPRWASGTSTLGIGYKHDMFIGIVMPMNAMTPDFPSPLGYDRNLLVSPMGYNLAFDFTSGFPFSIGGNLTVLEDFDGEDPYENLQVIKVDPDPTDLDDFTNDFFHLSSIGQLYYPIMFKDRQQNPTVAFRLDLGGGYMNIQRAHLVQEGEAGLEREGVTFTEDQVGKMVTFDKYEEYFDVYFRLSFINLSAKNNYGMGLQYFSGSMMADAWLELTDWFRVEMKYSFLLRDREVWEQESSYFLITPRFRFGLPSLFN